MIHDHYESARDWALEHDLDLLDDRSQPSPKGGPTYYCDTCDEHFYGDEVEPEYDHRTGTERMAHEGPVVSVGGDGYGGKCCAVMDSPTIHWVSEVKERSRFDLFNQTADALKEASRA